MKFKKILGISGIILVLSLLLTLVPVTPASAQTVTLTVTSGKVGSSVTVIGSSFPASTTVGIYFSNQLAAAGGTIGTSITTYQFVSATTLATGVTTFTATFTVPSTLNVGGNIPVTGGTYYLYFVYLSGGSSTTIILVQPFTVIGNPTITISPSTGTTGTSVTVTGTDFTPNTILSFRYDSTTITPTGGQTSTLSTGGFSSVISIPSTSAGAHTITATAGSSTDSETFTATASAALDTPSPTSGTPGTDVTLSGSNYPANATLSFKLDSTTMTRKSGNISTSSGGSFITIVTIPTSATAGAHTITATAGSGTATASFTVIAPATLNDLSPNSGRGGADVSVTGSNFDVNTALTFKFDTTVITPKSGATTTADGHINSVITIPASAGVGAHTVTVTAGGDTASKTFTVTAPATSVNVVANGDNIGAEVDITGSGFQNNSTITVTYDGNSVATTSAFSGGLFITKFIVPPSLHGAHNIVVTDGTNSENVTFTVESTAPGVPIPIAPAMGASIKSPYLFDWSDVTDPSAPVTYELQIASSPDFASGSVVLDKTGLKESQYNLSTTEVTQLTGNISTYYWRERATDAASNASAWTGAAQFTVSKPFKFTGWPLYVSIVVGAVVFFLLGLWAGRRSAFSY